MIKLNIYMQWFQNHRQSGTLVNSTNGKLIWINHSRVKNAYLQLCERCIEILSRFSTADLSAMVPYSFTKHQLSTTERQLNE